MLDRVAERRRAAQLARHYRDEEGLAIAEIARRLGRAEATIKAYLYDPTGDKARAVKARYRGVCRGCGSQVVCSGVTVELVGGWGWRLAPGWFVTSFLCLWWSGVP